MKLENVLNELASANVTRADYPDPIPTIEDQIQAKRDEIYAYEKEKDPEKAKVRPQPKRKYLALLDQLNSDLNALIAENDQIIQDNRDARQAVKDQYASDIEAYKALDSSKWTALAIVVNDALRESEWMVIKDSGLTSEQESIAKDYRKSLMDLNKDYETSDEAIDAFELIEANKPDWALW